MNDKVYVFEGKTSTEAIEKGLKELNVSKNKVDIKILEEEEKRSFFSILTPRIVKVEMKLKDNPININKKTNSEKSNNHSVEKKDIELNDYVKKVDVFLNEFISKLPTRDLNCKVEEGDNCSIKVNIDGNDAGYLIGYRGDVLNSIQTVLTNIVTKESKEKIKVLVDIGGYREKREKDLQNLASKIANSVIKNRKNITLEPMPAYERKIIHTKLQDNDKIKTFSVGEEPYRKVVVSLK